MLTIDEATQLEHELDMFNGTEHWYPHFIPGILFTDGIKYLADKAKAYWFIDIIASYQGEEKVKNEMFQVWILKVNDDRTAMVTCEDGNGHIVASQKLSYTDFPLKEYKVYLVNDGQNKVILLTGEY